METEWDLLWKRKRVNNLLQVEVTGYFQHRGKDLTDDDLYGILNSLSSQGIVFYGKTTEIGNDLKPTGKVSYLDFGYGGNKNEANKNEANTRGVSRED